MLKILLSEDKPYIWNAEDARVIREEYRLVGSLVGCLARLAMQNIHLGLPLQLMKEEAKLLLDLGVAVMLDNSQPVSVPTQEEVETFKEERKELYVGQMELLRENRKKEVIRRQDEIIEGKTSKRRRVLKEQGLPEAEIEEQLSTLQRQLEENIESIEIAPLHEKHSCVQISTACLRPADLPRVDWKYPTNPREALRSRVFRDLWEKGYYLSNGGKFGGDFLVYPGEPSRYHSFYIARCVEYEETMPALDMVAMGRLGSSVKKTILLCSIDQRDHVTYTSLQWSGLG